MNKFSRRLFAWIGAAIFLFVLSVSGVSALAYTYTQTGTVVNCTTGVNVRSGPGTSYTKLGTALKGATYSVTGTSGSWYQIKYNGKKGYVSKSFLFLSAQATGTAISESKTGTIVNCTSSVNVRSGPGTSYAILGTALKSAAYAVTAATGPWYRINYNGKTGYVNAEYLSVTNALVSPASVPTQTRDKVIAGYYASWAAYEGYSPLDIPAEKLTHINYAFANISSGLKIAMGDSKVDPSNFAKLRELKKQYPHLKTLISVGGWTWSGRFSEVARTQESRSAFAQSVVAFIKEYGFDGVDIDWEYPGGGGLEANVTSAQDKANFTLLMAELRAALDAQGSLDGCGYLLTFAGAAGSFYAKNVELDNLHKYVDFAIIMAYDIHGQWDRYTDFNAPLFTPKESSPQYQWSCDDAVKVWAGSGFPKSKIVMGVPFYGIQFSGVHNGNRGVYQPFEKGASISYDQIVSTRLSNAAFERFVHADAHVPWLFNGDTFVSYDDAQSISKKGAYIRDSGIRGAGIWELSQNADGTLLTALYKGMQ